MAENQESIFGFEKSPRNCHSSVDNKRKIEMWKECKKDKYLPLGQCLQCLGYFVTKLQFYKVNLKIKEFQNKSCFQ